MKKWIIPMLALLMCVALAGCSAQQVARMVFPFALPEASPQPSAPASESTAREQFDTLTFEVPNSWHKETRENNTFYYTPNDDFLMLGKDDLGQKMNESNVEGFMQGFRDVFTNYREVNHELREVNSLTVLEIENWAEIAEEDVLCFTAIVQNGTEVVIFTFVTQEDSTADNRADFDRVVASVKAVSCTPHGSSSESAAANAPEPAGGKGVTLEQFNRLKETMTYAEVVDVFGFEGEFVANVGDDGVMYMWYDEDNAQRNISCYFEKGKMKYKRQSGLE